jgi:hypothetical protein
MINKEASQKCHRERLFALTFTGWIMRMFKICRIDELLQGMNKRNCYIALRNYYCYTDLSDISKSIQSHSRTAIWESPTNIDVFFAAKRK